MSTTKFHTHKKQQAKLQFYINLLPYFLKEAVLSLAQTSTTRALSLSGVAGIGEVTDPEDKTVRFF